MNKYNFLNVYRLIMAILVVICHTNVLTNIISQNIMVSNIYNFLVQLAVPFFFLSTGFFLGKKIEKSNNSTDEIEIIKKKRNKTIKLYIFFTIIYLPLTIYGFISEKTGIIKSIILFFRGFLFVGENFNSWFLWYLLSEIIGLTFIATLLKKRNNYKTILFKGLLLFTIGIIISFINSQTYDDIIMAYISTILKFFIPNGRIFYSIVFTSIGIIISEKEIKVKKMIILKIIPISMTLLLFLINTVFYNIFVNRFSILLCSVLIFVFIINIRFNNDKFADYCKFMSEKLYFWHMYIYSFVSLIIDGFIYYNYGATYFVLTMIIALIIFTPMYYICKRNLKEKK